MRSNTTSPCTRRMGTAGSGSVISTSSSIRSAMRSPEAAARAMRPVYLAMSRSGFMAVLRYIRNSTMSPGVISPRITCSPPKPSTTAVDSPTSTSVERSRRAASLRALMLALSALALPAANVEATVSSRP